VPQRTDGFAEGTHDFATRTVETETWQHSDEPQYLSQQWLVLCYDPEKPVLDPLDQRWRIGVHQAD
jgi:hypothetical protein